MALSGSTNYNLTRDDIIKASLRKVGAISAGETPTATEINDGAQTFNIMAKAWQAKGLQLWVRKTQSITLTASKNTYTLGPTGDIVMDRPLRILEAVRRDSNNNDVPMTELTENEYWVLPNKSQVGVPVSYYFQPTLTNSTLYLWNTPGTTEAAEYTIQIRYHKPFDDFDAATDDVEFPPYWYEALVYGLAMRLAPEYGLGLDERSRLYVESQAIIKMAEDFDVETGSVYLQPDLEGRY
jgi:hypothetical protein